jgi:hypothetical protein
VGGVEHTAQGVGPLQVSCLRGFLSTIAVVFLAACQAGDGVPSEDPATRGVVDLGKVTGHTLVSDPYPATALQPDHFFIACDGLPPVRVPAARTADGRVHLRYDLSEFGPGLHGCSIAAAREGGQRSETIRIRFSR